MQHEGAASPTQSSQHASAEEDIKPWPPSPPSSTSPHPSSTVLPSPFTPSLLHTTYTFVMSLLLSAFSLFVSCRWRGLLPLYRRVDLPGFRGFAVVELLLIAAYAAVNAYYLTPLLWSMLYPHSDLPSYMLAMVRASVRLGTVGTWNVLALWLPVTRHSVWNYALGISFDRSLWYTHGPALSFPDLSALQPTLTLPLPFLSLCPPRVPRYHIWLSRTALFILALHALGLYAWTLYKHTFVSELTAGGWTGKVPTGEIALAGGLFLLLTSIQRLRRRCWELFLRAHYVGLIVFTVFSMLHDPLVVRVSLAGVVLYGVDVLMRCWQWTRPVVVVDLRVLDGDVTRVEWSSPHFRFKAGQFVMVCIPLLSPFEWHPYSISSAPHHRTVVLHSQRRGEWTTRLQQLARTFDPSNLPRMYVEGPYGSLSLPLPLYRHVLLVSGGLGVTPMLSVYHDLRKRRGGGERGGMDAVRFVWAMRDERLIDSVWRDIEALHHRDGEYQPPVTPSMSSPSSSSSCPSSLSSALLAPIPPSSPSSPSAFRPFFHITSSSSSSSSSSATAPRDVEEGSATGGWEVAKGRPPLTSMFCSMKEQLRASATAGGSVRCAVLVCGPDALIRRCRRLCLQQSDRAWCGAAGGRGRVCFDMHEETYAW